MTNYQDQADTIAAAHARATSYGAYSTNPLSAADLAARDAIDYSAPETPLSDPNLVKVTRLRLLTDPGFPWWYVSYCYGELRDGTPVRVWLGAGQINKGGKFGFKGHLVELARRAGRNAKALGLLDDSVLSLMR